MREIITQRYKRETGSSAYKFNWFGKKIHNQDYINWLEKQCTIRLVRCSLPDIEKQKLIEDTYLLNLQNLSSRKDFEEAFRLGFETGVNNTIEYLNEK
jgi:hypothetical protein